MTAESMVVTAAAEMAALFMVVVPVALPMVTVVAALPIFNVVAVVLKRLAVTEVVVISPPFTATSPVVILPVAPVILIRCGNIICTRTGINYLDIGEIRALVIVGFGLILIPDGGPLSYQDLNEVIGPGEVLAPSARPIR
jgi:hypothetical protein